MGDFWRSVALSEFSRWCLRKSFQSLRTVSCFEPEYSSNEESSNSSDENESSNSNEERIGRLGTLEWCKCENCSTTTLNHPRECLCCRETPEASALTYSMKCIIQHDDFEAVCLTRAVLKTTLVRIKHLVQGMENFNVLPQIAQARNISIGEHRRLLRNIRYIRICME